MQGAGVVQDVGPQRGVGVGGSGCEGGHGPQGRGHDVGPGPRLADPQLLEVEGGEAPALRLHLLQHPGGPPSGRGQRVEETEQGGVILHGVIRVWRVVSDV